MSDTIELGPLEEYLRNRLPERKGLRVTKLRRTPGGMSRETWFADAEWGSVNEPERQRLTVRIDHDTGSVIATPIARQSWSGYERHRLRRMSSSVTPRLAIMPFTLTTAGLSSCTPGR